MTSHDNREAWLGAATLALGERFTAAGYAVPTAIRVAIGFPSSGRLSSRVGECWSPEASADGNHEIFIRADRSDPVDILAILVHELVHAVVGNAEKHGPRFRRCALALGLEGKMTATRAGPALKSDLAKLAENLGKLPHGAMNWQAGRKKQTTRLLKVCCPECGYVVRVAGKWLDEMGPPHCPEHGPMEVQ
jgi:hypothetical protein